MNLISRLCVASLAFSTMAGTWQTSARAETTVQDLQRRAHGEYVNEMLDKLHGGSSSRRDPMDDAWARAFGSLFGVWLGRKVSSKPKTHWVTNVPECIQNYITNERKFARATNPRLPPFKLPANERWIVVYNKDNAVDAVTVACWTATMFPSAQAFRLKDGSYMVTVGNEVTKRAEGIVRQYTSKGEFPPETFLVRGDDIADRVWASPNVQATEIRNGFWR